MMKLGYGLSFKQGLVLGYSGLRGAVSLTLALIVYLDHDVSHEIRDLVMFHTSGITLLTLLINGTTIGMVVRCLGLMRLSKVKKRVLSNLMNAYEKEVDEIISQLQHKKNFSKCDWEKIRLLARSRDIRRSMIKRKLILEDEHNEDDENQNLEIDRRDYSDEELYIEAKHRYYTTLKGIYWDFYEQGQCSANVVFVLIESADRALDHIEDRTKDYQFLESYFQSNWYMKCLLKLRNNCCCRWFLKGSLYGKVSFVYDVTVNYVEAHEE